MKQGKLWGETRLIEQTPFFELRHAKFRAGKACSIHHHQFCLNGFYVLEGVLDVVVRRDNGVEDRTRLASGDYTSVEPGLSHRFEGVRSGEVIEIYWPAPIGAPDIVREDQGGDVRRPDDRRGIAVPPVSPRGPKPPKSR